MKRNFFVNMLGGVVGFFLALLLISFTHNANALNLDRPAVDQSSPSNISAPNAVPISTTFTYQGQLKTGGANVSGTCNMAFRLYDDPAAGSLIGSPITTSVSITNGLFTVGLNFGSNAFTGDARWLAISVDCGSGFIGLSPRQALTAAPYALHAADAWSINGNRGTNPQTDFLGTTDNQPLLVKTNGIERMRINANGYVGLGSMDPNQQLEVGGNILIQPSSGSGSLFIQNASNTNFSAVVFNDDTGTYRGYLSYIGASAGLGGRNDTVEFGTNNKNLTFRPNNTEVMRLTTNSKVGIGLTNPTAKLEVQGPDNISNTMAFQVEGTGNLAPSLSVSDEGYVGIGLGDGVAATHACYAQDTSLGVAFWLALCSSAAEYVPTIDAANGFPEAADVVSIAPTVSNPYGDEHDPFVVQKSATPCDVNLLGFIVNPALGGDGKKLNDHYLPLAIFGSFPVKVTTENGGIHRGDPLTSSSKPGYAMKATGACKIIGYALEDVNTEGTIQVFANLGENTSTQVTTLAHQMDDLKAQNAALEARLTALEQSVTAQANNVPTANNLPLGGLLVAVLAIAIIRQRRRNLL